MTDDRPAPTSKRRERLEAQLRENLKRRKEQARARREPPPGGRPEAAAADEAED